MVARLSEWTPVIFFPHFLGEARVSRGTTAGEHQQDGGGGQRTSDAQVFTGDA